MHHHTPANKAANLKFRLNMMFLFNDVDFFGDVTRKGLKNDRAIQIQAGQRQAKETKKQRGEQK